MPFPFADPLGPERRFRPASPRSWLSVEAWLGFSLPGDYKEFVDGYGDAIIHGHLFIPHPEGSDPLLGFIQEERSSFQESYADVHNIPERLLEVWEDIVPWAYHDWNGDVCLLFPDSNRNNWRVAVAFRQCPEFMMTDGGINEFLAKILVEKKFPRGWPDREPVWRSMPNSPLI